MNELYELNPHKMITQEKAQCVSWFIDQMFRPSETTEVWKRPTIMSFNSFMAQEIYGDRNSVQYKEEWATKNI